MSEQNRQVALGSAKRSRRKPTRAKQLGVTDDEYDRLLAAQDGHCALCPNRPQSRRLHVDHDHRTGRIRGLLCHSCNRRLWTGATAAWLLGATRYICAAEGHVIIGTGMGTSGGSVTWATACSRCGAWPV